MLLAENEAEIARLTAALQHVVPLARVLLRCHHHLEIRSAMVSAGVLTRDVRAGTASASSHGSGHGGRACGDSWREQRR